MMINQESTVKMRRIEDVLSIHLIADKILEGISDREVLECSLVCRLWRQICRRYLRDRRVYLIRMNPTCSSLQLVNDLVGNSMDLPSVGVSFQDLKAKCSEEAGKEWTCCRDADLVTLYPFVFKLQLKVLKISYYYWKKEDCVGDKLLREIIKRKGESIEEMIILDWPDSIPSLWGFLNHTGKSVPVLFPSLRICKLQRLPEVSVAKPVLIREIVLSAPRLSYLDGIIPPGMFSSEDEKNLTPQFPRNKYGVIKAFRASDAHSVCALASAKPRLEYLSLWPSLIDHDGGMIERVRQGIASLCESSTESLKVLSCRYNMNMLHHFISGKRYVNLTRLHVRLARNEFYHVNNMLFKSLDFQHMFPNLHKVELTFDPVPDEGYFPDCETLKEHLLSRGIYGSPGEPDKYHCSSVTEILLVFPLSELYDYTAKLLRSDNAAKIFPNVRTLCFKEFSESDVSNFWCHFDDQNISGTWKRLETLGYYYNVETWRFPYFLVYVFCGLGMYELQALLQDIDEDSLKAWQHAPRKSSRGLTTFSRVRKIQIFLEHKGREEESCNREPISYTEDVETVFSQIITWVRAKIPELFLEVVVVDPCSENCDPFRLEFTRDFFQAKKHRCTASDRVQLCWTYTKAGA